MQVRKWSGPSTSVLTLCGAGLFELLQQLLMGEQVVAELEQSGLLFR